MGDLAEMQGRLFFSTIFIQSNSLPFFTCKKFYILRLFLYLCGNIENKS